LAGLGNIDLIRRVGELFQLHPLALEDALHRGQRPKAEDYAQHGFVVLQHPAVDPEDRRVRMTQIALFFADPFVVTLQADGGDVLAPLRERLAQPAARSLTADYLAYTIMDFVVDSAFPVLEAFGDQVETLEERATRARRPEDIQDLHRLRRDLLHLRRVFWPQREVMAHIMREGELRFAADTRLYLRDLYDHAVQVLDVVESYREMVVSLVDLDLSRLSIRLNEVIRVLTVISTVFMPLSFIASVYGMNFDRRSPWNMPELGWQYGYLAVWALMIGVTVAMILFFRRKKWL
jgi:magnesium transporter